MAFSIKYWAYGILSNTPVVKLIYEKAHRGKIGNWANKTMALYLNEARQNFSNGSAGRGSLEDYSCAMRKHLVSYSEYMHQFEFWKLDENERNEYVSRLKMEMFYRLYLPAGIKHLFWDKSEFLSRYGNLIHRDWLDMSHAGYNDFHNLVTSYDSIVKPANNCCGYGIYKLPKQEDTDLRDLFSKVRNEKALVEQCIEGCDGLQCFHPQSLNTLRVVTMVIDGKHSVFHSFLRMGAGNSVVDNAHAGGLFAQVDVETGIIESDGITVNGDHYTKHPDSGITIKGYQIPRWDEIRQYAESASSQIPGLFIVGWDITIMKDGQIEIIEGNHGPDWDVMQSPLKKGYRQMIEKAVMDYYHKSLDEMTAI